jgi:translation initiation factor IF-2
MKKKKKVKIFMQSIYYRIIEDSQNFIDFFENFFRITPIKNKVF